MTPAERLSKAATLLGSVATLLEDDPISPLVKHLARAARLRAVTLDATIHIELPAQKPVRYTVRQQPEGITIIDRETGEKRETSLLDFVNAGSAQGAWDKVGQ